MEPSHRGIGVSRALQAPGTPFIKWAGGKRWLAPLLCSLAPSDAKHVEPFVGSGAFFFASLSRSALLSDVNAELMNCYKVVRDEPQALIGELSRLPISKKVFETLRSRNAAHVVDRAVRFIYLNRTAFNGIYRVNKLGKFNVPYGCKPGTQLCDAGQILRCSERLAVASLATADFADIIRGAALDDLIYLDPPYTVKHDSNGFRRYNESLFSWSDQERLAKLANEHAIGGGRVIVTNARHVEVIRLYRRSAFTAFSVERPTNLAANPSARGRCREILLISRRLGDELPNIRRTIRDHLHSRARQLSLS